MSTTTPLMSAEHGRMKIFSLLLTAAFCLPTVAFAQEEVTIEKGVLVIHRTFGGDMPELSPDGKVLAICGNEQLRFLNPFTGQRIGIFPQSESYPRQVRWMPDGKALATLGDTIAFWNALGKEVLTIKPEEFATPDRPQHFTSLALSPDGKSMAIGFGSGDIVITPIANRAQAKRLAGAHSANVAQLVWEGDTLYSGGGYGDGQVCLWNATTGLQIKKFAAHAREVRGMALHPDGKTLATQGEKNDVILWDVASAKPLVKLPVDPTLEEGSLKPGDVAFLNEGELVVASQGSNLQLWTAQGEPIQTFTGHNGRVRKIDVSADGKLVASAGGDTTRVWKVENMLPPQASVPKRMRRNPAAIAASKNLNNLRQWEVVRGDWKQQDGSLFGAGDSRINFAQEFPNDITLQFKLKIHGETNPRVRFDAFHFGYEGRNQRFFLHGPKAQGEPLPFEYDREYEIKVQIQDDTATLWIDGQQIAQSHPPKNDKRKISIEGGGRQSMGASEFYDFQIDY